MPSDPQRVQNLFLQIVEQSPSERRAVLDRECGSDVILRQRIEALLKAHEESDSLLDQPSDRFGATVVSRAADNAPADMMTGERRPEPERSKRSGSPGTAETNIREESIAGAVIGGRYTMVQRIGEGGLGEVWVAKQTEPVKRKVALKLIKMGMDSKAVLTRFEQERQALALMDHPNIARVLDGGITPTGQPYFVMELVNGLPLNKFCDEARLTPNERLQLFIPICQAVQHAHQKGIVHRDLKPANILVTMIDGKPVPKVIDFGVAKATSGKLTDESLSTQFGAVVGTLEYMSPEQAGFSGEDIDTRADIYSLGVILYELLTGLRPIDAKRMRNAAIVEMIRIIREDEPSKPSTRLSTDESLPSMAALRQTEPKKLMALLRGELDWVVMKCLEKSRDRRYETANALSRDIQRYLVDEPVEARPPSAGYRLSKFLRRHKGPVIAAGLVLLTLVGGMVGITYFAIRADRNATAASASAKAAAENARVAQTNARTAAIEKDRADSRANDARRNMYAAHMNLAQSNWEGTNVGATSELLARYAPGTPNADLCGFEWHYWDRLIHSPLLELNEHSGGVSSVAFSPDGKLLASAGWDQTVKVWDPMTGQKLLTLEHPKEIGGIDFSPDGMRLASAGSDGMLRVWDVRSGQETLTIPGHTEEVSDVVFSPDGKRLATASFDETVKVWDAITGQEIVMLKGTNVEAFHLAFSPDGKWLASDGVSGAITMWDATSGQAMLTFTESTNDVSCLAFSPDGKWLAANGIGETVTMWDTLSGQQILTLNTGRNDQFAFSPDGTRLASVSEDQAVKVWGVTSGQLWVTLKGHTREVYDVVFSPNGKRLASASGDGTVKVWDAAMGQETLTLKGHTSGVSSVVFTPDGDRLASISNEGTVKVWDATIGQEIQTLNTGNGMSMGITRGSEFYSIGVGSTLFISRDGENWRQVKMTQ
jgi:WD40 repeat protein/serine/threonine protein kinase